jgi:hypothetical protein
MIRGHWGNGNGNGNCNSNGVDTSKRGNGDGGDRSFATGQRQRRRSIAMALGHWGKSNRTVLLQQNSDCNSDGNGALAAMCMFYFEDQCHGLWLIKTCKTCGRP